MTNPKAVNSLYIKAVNDKEYGVFTNAVIYRDSTIEYCTWLPVSQIVQLYIQKNSPALATRLFKNPDGIEKEREVLAQIAEMELQERLDRGLVTPEQVKNIILDVANPTKMMNVVSHSILLGFGSVYRKSQFPNISWEYDSNSKLYRFFTVQDVQANQELTYFSN